MRNDCSLVYGLRCQIHLVFCCVVDKAVLSFARPTELRDGEPFGSSCTPRSSLSKVGPTYSQRLNTRGHEQQSIQYCTRSRLSSCGSSIGTLCSSRAIEGATGGKCWCQVSLTMQHAPMSHDLCIATDEIINETIHCVDISRPNDDVPCSQVTHRQVPSSSAFGYLSARRFNPCLACASMNSRQTDYLSNSQASCEGFLFLFLFLLLLHFG